MSFDNYYLDRIYNRAKEHGSVTLDNGDNGIYQSQPHWSGIVFLYHKQSQLLEQPLSGIVGHVSSSCSVLLLLN